VVANRIDEFEGAPVGVELGDAAVGFRAILPFSPA